MMKKRVVDLTEEEKKAMKACVDAVIGANYAYELAVKGIRESNKKMWDLLRTVHPEIATNESPTFHHPDGDEPWSVSWWESGTDSPGNEEEESA